MVDKALRQHAGAVGAFRQALASTASPPPVESVAQAPATEPLPVGNTVPVRVVAPAETVGFVTQPVPAGSTVAVDLAQPEQRGPGEEWLDVAIINPVVAQKRF